ncbi:hypothetical protein [uncultured Adlercreutzia sp.]|uniref:hypothetical protein n=1 Tax=uncultured Adlercreutzia sp. TaxID=875803 RepID=UPI0025E71B86|nr:hypothetical protein [uncultured Adlercreutzia sp.]MCI9261496.1 hypothetical protein [Eggerthellaceae bacterium]MEE0705181.1 hypothetical protein [Adlercreutzia sp.]
MTDELENIDENEIDLERFMVVEDDGVIAIYETVATFHVDETGEDFIIFAEEDAEEGDEIEVMAALYNPAEIVEGEAGLPLVTLGQLESEEQMELVQAVLEDMMEEDDE